MHEQVVLPRDWRGSFSFVRIALWMRCDTLKAIN